MTTHAAPLLMNFASDNCSGIHPNILTAICDTNIVFASAYGNDAISQQLHNTIQHIFGAHASGYPVLNGTAANIIALQALSPRHGAVICTTHAHIYNDEGNAAEYVAGVRLLAQPSHDGKLHPDIIAKVCQAQQGNVHAAQPSCVYISQVTELGTCYRLEEIAAIKAVCATYGLYLYMDGARIANAAAFLNCTLSDLAAAGVDMLSIGGTKNGLMLGELLVVLNPTLDAQMQYLRKINLQLFSKMRFLAAQFMAWFQEDLWWHLAKHSNSMAKRLSEGIHNLPHMHITQAVESNAVFLSLPHAIKTQLLNNFYFYDWHIDSDEVRLMTSFDTTCEQVDALIAALKLASSQISHGA